MDANDLFFPFQVTTCDPGHRRRPRTSDIRTQEQRPQQQCRLRNGSLFNDLRIRTECRQIYTSLKLMALAVTEDGREATAVVEEFAFPSGCRCYQL